MKELGLNLNASRQVILVTTLLVVFSSSIFLIPCRGAEIFIGHADQANLANLAQNIAEGNGPVVDIAWIHTNGGLPGKGKLPQPEPYWSLYPAFIIAPFFKILGYTRASLIIPALAMRGIIIGICTWLIYNETSSRLASISAAAILCFTPLLNSHVNGLSDIYVATSILASIFLLALGLRKRTIALIFMSGLAAGASIGMKISGAVALTGFLPLCVATLITTSQCRSVRICAAYVLGAFGGVIGYLGYNLYYFGSLTPPGIKLVSEAALIRYFLNKQDFEGAHNYAFYNPEASTSGMSTVPIAYYVDNFKQFVGGIASGSLIPLWWAPFALAGIAILVLSLKQKRVDTLSISELFLLASMPVLASAILLATRVHFEARYWLFCVPFVIVLSYYAISKLTLRPNFFYSVLLLLSMPYALLNMRSIAASRCNLVTPAYARVKQLIPSDSVVITSNPWQFSFHTRIKSVATPYTPKQNIISKIANRYNASYLAVVDNDIRNVELAKLLASGELGIAKKIYEDKRLTLYKLMR